MCKLAGTVSFPAALVLTSQMSDHDLINHTLAILVILNRALKSATRHKQSFFIRLPLSTQSFYSHIIAACAFTSDLSFMHPSLISIHASLL